MALYSAESNRGWVSFRDGEWEECEVVDSTEKQLNLRIAGQQRTLQRNQCQFCYRNPSAVEESDDFLTLPNLDEPNILHSLRVRYWKGHVYSYTGPILIAVNPWRNIDIYNINVLEGFKSGKLKNPHIFGVATKAFRDLMASRKNQCILISGESGAGKTESTKYVLQVLTVAGDTRTSASASIEQQVMLTNPVLEAFGNAKTLRNDNSSRFGKWINVHFDRKGTIAGAEIKTYLLEKARVIHQTAGERNYHIFYQVCKAAPSQPMLQKLGFRDATAFNYTKVCQTAANMDDARAFDRTKQALHFIGFDQQSQESIFAAVAAVLHIGNLALGQNKEGDATLTTNESLQAMTALLNLEVEDVRNGLCHRLITAGTDVMIKPETAEKANQARDALAKVLYSKLFDYIVSCVNTALRLKTESVTMLVSVLDIFGFEVFQTNHFEQFCINYANEKLQLHFNHFNFMLERALYQREGIELVESDFVDNSACVALIEGKGWGVQAILDDVCIMPKGDDRQFLDRLMQSQQIKTHSHFGSAKSVFETFVVNHYAGSVAYTIHDFCEKNKDLLAVDVVQMMQKSKSKFFASLFENQATDVSAKPGRRGGGGGGGMGSVAYKSVSATFKTDLAMLMEAINTADPHFVRCVNPNSQKAAQLFENQKAVEQLRCGGVIEAVRMCRESYPSRYTHADFYGTFNCLCQAIQGTDARARVGAMLLQLKVDAAKYRLGRTMVLLKREVVDNMERMRAQLLGGRARVLQNSVRRFIARQDLARHREVRRMYAATVAVQAACRRRVTRAKYVRMVQAVREQERKRREEEERRRREQEDLARNSRAAAEQAAQHQQQHQQPPPPPQQQQQPASAKESSRAAVLEGLDDSGDEDGEAVQGYLEDQARKAAPSAQTRALTTQDESAPVSPLCIRIQVHAEGITEALLFHVDLLASAIRQAVLIKDHKSFLKVHPNTFRGQAAIDWLRGHAARALFGADADKEKNQQLSRSVALLLGQKLLAVGVFRQVTGSLTKPLEDPNALFRFHEDEKEGPLLNCRSIWFQNAREPLLVVSELLYTMLNLRSRLAGRDLRESEDLNNFTAAAAELQLVNINDLSRIQLLAFFLNAYNLMVLHAHVVRGSIDGADFKAQKIPFTRDNQYMIAAYNYSLAEIEERLFCRVLRAKFPKKSDKSRAPEPRVHFALSLCCGSSPQIRIYQPESLDEDLQQAAIEYLNSADPHMNGGAPPSPSRARVQEVVLPKVFKWYRDDFGFSKQEILAYYASFMRADRRAQLIEVARANNFIIKYDKYDWTLNLTKACSDVGRIRPLITSGQRPAAPAPARALPPPAARAPPTSVAPPGTMHAQTAAAKPAPGGHSVGYRQMPPAAVGVSAPNQPIVGLQQDEAGLDGFMC